MMDNGLGSDEEQTRIRALLSEDFENEGESFASVVSQLRRWKAPPISPDEIERASHTLRARLKAQRRGERIKAVIDWWPLQLLRSELRVVRGEIRFTSALVLGIGVLVTLLTFQTSVQPAARLPIVYAAPVVAAIGMAFVFSPSLDAPLEVILAASRSIRVVLLARLTLVFGFNLLFGLVSSVVLAALRTDLTLLPLVQAWLAPMTFLSALAFFMAVLSKEPLVGGIVSLMLWVLHRAELPFVRLPDLATLRPWLWAAAALLGCAALWLAGRSERWIGGAR